MMLAPDHPRSRGEYLRFAEDVDTLHGSSPLSRGIHLHVAGRGLQSRIIPALAGNTCDLLKMSTRCTDHPRSRGEYISTSLAEDYRAGSSPLSRGIHTAERLADSVGGIIPALAGNTHGGGLWRVRGGDHPRSRGEYSAAVTGAIGSSGSSPLSRGIRVCDDSSFPAGGIIPALAGNTTGWRELTATDRDHPRSRGEYEEGGEVTGGESGSSPL